MPPILPPTNLLNHFNDLSDWFVIFNVIFGVSAAYWEFRCVHELKDNLYRWIKVLYALTGILWAVAYLLVFIEVENTAWISWFGQNFVRGGILFTLGIITAGGIFRYRVIKAEKRLLTPEQLKALYESVIKRT